MTETTKLVQDKIDTLPKIIKNKTRGLPALIEFFEQNGFSEDIDGFTDFLISKFTSKDPKELFSLIRKSVNGLNSCVLAQGIYEEFINKYNSLSQEEQEQFKLDFLDFVYADTSNDVPQSLMKFLVLKFPEDITIHTATLKYNGLIIASVSSDGQGEDYIDFSFFHVETYLKGLGLGHILLQSYLSHNFDKNKENKHFHINAYSVKSDNFIAQKLYMKFGGKFLDKDGSIITQEEYIANNISANMLFDYDALEKVYSLPQRPFITYDKYKEKHNITSASTPITV